MKLHDLAPPKVYDPDVISSSYRFHPTMAAPGSPFLFAVDQLFVDAAQAEGTQRAAVLGLGPDGRAHLGHDQATLTGVIDVGGTGRHG